MPIDGDALEVANLLVEEGFGSLAAELLLELETGPRIDVDSGSVDDPDDLLKPEAARRRVTVSLEGGVETTRRYAEPTSDASPPDPSGRVPEGEQLAYAVRFLRANLVDPLLALEEAEKLGAEIRESYGEGFGEAQTDEDLAPFGAHDAPSTGVYGSDQASNPEDGEAARGGEEGAGRPQEGLTIVFGNPDRSAGKDAVRRPRGAEVEDVLRRLGGGEA